MVPPALRKLAGSPEFWADYFGNPNAIPDYPELKGCRVSLAVGKGSALELALDEHLAEATLYLRHPALHEPTQLAWDDQASPYPYALRWEELEAICRAAVPDDHPGLPLLLFHRFAPICAGDDAARISALLAAAWRAVGIADDVALRYIERADRRDRGFKWAAHEPEGWVADGGDDMYSLRARGYEKFPFAAFAAFVAEAERRAKKVPVKDLPPGPTLRERHDLEVVLVRPGEKQSIAVGQALRKALGDSAEVHPGAMSATTDDRGKSVIEETRWIVTVRGELEPALAHIRAAMKAHAPKGSYLLVGAKKIPVT